MTAEPILRRAEVAELEGELVGYAFWHPSYDTESALRGSYLTDLYVRGSVRGRGVARRLLAEVARRTRERAGDVVWWVMYEDNELARGFYRRVARAEPGLLIWVLAGDDFERLLAAEA